MINKIGTLALMSVPLIMEAQDRPNFVWMLSEDNSKHYMNIFDKNGAETPRIRGMAEAGVVFTNAFSNAPVCSVARTTLITSCYAPRIGTQNHRKQQEVSMPEGVKMFPAYLKEAGYYTTNNRKKDYNAVEGNNVWNESSKRASWRNRVAGQPFFHMETFGDSHESSLHFSGKYMQNNKTETDPASVNIAPYHPDTETFRYTYARYHDRMHVNDRKVGAILDKLKADGLLENTFIFYFGDHGGVLPRSKGYAYESGLHIPLVVRVPEKWRHLVDVKPGSMVNGFVSFVDFGPTLLKLAGVSIPDGVDGKPFLGKGITREGVNKRDVTFGYADRFDEKYDMVRTIRKGRFKYMRSYQPFNYDGLFNEYRYKMLAYKEWKKLYNDGKLNDVQSQFFLPREPEALYDIENDPHEINNLAKNPEYKDELFRLRKMLSEKVKSMPDLSFYPESELLRRAVGNPVKFGQDNRTNISEMVDIADLSLISYKKAKKKLKSALKSSDPWKRYWALITCSTFGTEAKKMSKLAKKIAKSDSEPLVRVRAAEFLGLTGQDDPRQYIMNALKLVNDGTEANLILNSCVLLQDGKPDYKFTINQDDLNPEVFKVKYVKQRLSYLNR